MYELQWIISASVKTGVSSEQYPASLRLLWDLYLSYIKG